MFTRINFKFYSHSNIENKAPFRSYELISGSLDDYNCGNKYSKQVMSQLFSPFPPISMFLGPIFGSHSTLKLGGRGFLAFLPVVRTFFTIIVDLKNKIFPVK